MSVLLMRQQLVRSTCCSHIPCKSLTTASYSSNFRSSRSRGASRRDWQDRDLSFQQERRAPRDRWQNTDNERQGRWNDNPDRAPQRFSRGAGPRPEQYRGRRDEADRPETSTSLLQANWKGDALYGISPVLAALKFGRRALYTLHVQEGLAANNKKDQSSVTDAIKAAAEAGAAVNEASKHDLNMVSNNRPHQGVVLDCSPLSFLPLDSLQDASAPALPEGRPPLWLVLDEVMDPQNFGAALRSAHFLGATGVLTCSRNSAPLSPVVSKASAGAMEAMSVHSAQNLPRTLAAAASSGWQIIGAASESNAVNCLDIKLTRPTLLVLGNEGVGLRTNVRSVCHSLVRVDTGYTPEDSGVDSLNVSVATGILLHQLLTTHRLN